MRWRQNLLRNYGGGRRIMRSSAVPEVSVICDVFMHENYIRECLDSILMQKTSFPFEIIVHDDASSDRSSEIIMEYERMYPDIIKALCQRENKYSKGIPIDRTYNIGRVRGKYIAFCEGDDWWTDPMKLQKQYDYMESHPECSLCFTDFVRFHHKTGVTEHFRTTDKTVVSSEDLLLEGNVIGTLTAFSRSALVREYFDSFFLTMPRFPMGDYPMWLWLSSKGSVCRIPEVTSSYRVLENSACHFPDFGRRLDFEMAAFDIRLYFCGVLDVERDISARIREMKWQTAKAMCKSERRKVSLMKIRIAAFADKLLHIGRI